MSKYRVTGTLTVKRPALGEKNALVSVDEVVEADTTVGAEKKVLQPWTGTARFIRLKVKAIR